MNILKRMINTFPLCGTTCLRNVIYSLWFLLLALPIHQYFYFRFEFAQWDLLLFTGLLAFILGLNLMLDIRQRFETTLKRLMARKTIKMERDKSAAFLTRLEDFAQFWARVFGLISCVAMFVAFSVALINSFYWQRALLGIVETFWAYVAGTLIGRLVSYGQIGRYLVNESIEIELLPSHVDGVAGLKPIGDFIFYQAKIASIPAIFLASWWFLFPLWPRDYSHWEDAFLGLLSMGIFIEIVAFMFPIWLLHKIMVREKEKWMKEADRLSQDIAEYQVSISEMDNRERIFQPEVVEDMTRQYWAIENMMTWPVDIKIKKQFKLNNIMLFIPLLGDIAKRSIDWNHIKPLLKQLGL